MDCEDCPPHPGDIDTPEREEEQEELNPNAASQNLQYERVDEEVSFGIPRVVPSGPPLTNAHIIPKLPIQIRPEPYDGSGDWPEYLVYYEQFAQLHGWDERTQANVLGLCLQGEARSVLASLNLQQRSSYTELKAALTQNFSPQEHVYLYQAELRGRKRKPGESLTTLGREVARMVRLAYPTADQVTRETIGINAFLDALPGHSIEIRLHVIKGHPKTLHEAIAYALEVDAVLEAESRKGQGHRRAEVRNVGEQLEQTDSDKSEMQQMKEAIEKLEKQLANATKRKYKSSITCYNCGKKGHIKRECKAPLRNPAAGQGNAEERLPHAQQVQPL